MWVRAEDSKPDDDDPGQLKYNRYITGARSKQKVKITQIKV